MANICNNTYVVYGKKAEVKKLYDFLAENCHSYHITYREFYEKLSLNHEELELDAGGEIYDYELEEDDDNSALWIYTNTKWDEIEDFRDVIFDKFDITNIYYQAEEYGNEIFVTNDIKHRFFDPIKVEYQSDECDSPTMYFTTWEEALPYISDIVGYTISTKDEVPTAVDKFCEKHEDTPLLVFEAEYDD